VSARLTRAGCGSMNNPRVDEPWLQSDYCLNPRRDPKIRKHISRGSTCVAQTAVRVEFPLSEQYILISPVSVIYAGYVKYEDRGTSEVLPEHGLDYSASEAGIKKADLFVLVFHWQNERYVRRIFFGRGNHKDRMNCLLSAAARKVALAVSKDERILYRRLHGQIVSSTGL